MADGNFVQAYLLVHALAESLLRTVLEQENERVNFNRLIELYQEYLTENHYPVPEFVDDLIQFNRRRNRIVHQLWRKGFTITNTQAEPAAQAAVFMYGLLIEWFGTFDDSIREKGFTLI